MRIVKRESKIDEEATAEDRGYNEKYRPIAREALRKEKVLCEKIFNLLPRRATAVASRHPLQSSSPESRGNFYYNNSGRGAPPECQPNGPSSGNRIAGEEATDQGKGLVVIWIVSEGFAGESYRHSEQLASC